MSTDPASRMRGFVVDTSGRPLGIQRAWPMLVFRGALLAVLGVVTLVLPALTATALVIIFGIFFVIDGLSSIAFGFARRRTSRGGGGWTAQGVFTLVLGLVAIIWPAAVAYLTLLLIGLFLLLVSIVALGTGLAMRRARSRAGGWVVGFAVVGIVLALVLIVNPIGGVLGLTLLFGVLLVLVGGALVAGGLRLRRTLPA